MACSEDMAGVSPDERGVDGCRRLVRIVHRGEGYVVVDKPANLLSVPGRGAQSDPSKADCVEARVRAMIHEAKGPVTVHRLDMETSGLMVFALTAEAHRELSEQFARRGVRKEYVALVQGWPAEDEGVIDLPLIVDWPRRPRQMVCFAHGKPARTVFRVVERTASTRAGEVARVVMRPITGRTHQLRVHCATGAVDPQSSSIDWRDRLYGPEQHEDERGWDPPRLRGLGCAIVGDVLYGRGVAGDRLLLHARRLGFSEPGTGRWLELASPEPF